MLNSMEWQVYSESFTKAAHEQGRSDGFIERCLAYAQQLFQNNLPVIYDELHFSRLVGYDANALKELAQNPHSAYVSYKIPKARGGYRQIHEPSFSLKHIQRWILDHILDRVPVHEAAKAFLRNRSIRDNATPHCSRGMVLSLDIKDFFSSIRRHRIRVIFEKMGYGNKVADFLSGLCTLDGVLPQGAPTSPALSNIAMLRVDRRLAGFAKQNQLNYTRYADDMSFSGRFRPGRVISMVRKILKPEGMCLHEDKIRLMAGHERQEVTGIVVNKKVQAPRDLRRKLRQVIYFIEKFGPAGHLSRQAWVREGYLRHLRGIAEFILFLNQDDPDAQKAVRILSELSESRPPDDEHVRSQ